MYFCAHLHKILTKKTCKYLHYLCSKICTAFLRKKVLKNSCSYPIKKLYTFFFFFFTFRLSTMPERLLFALIITEITLSLLAAELSGTVTLIFQFIDVPRKYLHFPLLSKIHSIIRLSRRAYFAFEHGCSPWSRVHFPNALPHNSARKLC